MKQCSTLSLCLLLAFFSFSNFLAAEILDCDGGVVSLANGDTAITVCLSDDEPDILELATTSTATGDSLFYCYFLTDENNVVKKVVEDPILDLSGFGPGVCRIYGVSFAGNMAAGVGIDLDNGFPLSNGECYELSDNFIELTKLAPNGGILATDDLTNICADDGMPDLITPSLDSAVGANFAWVITDSLGNILALPPAPPFDFEGTGPGVCLIWHLAWDGPLTGAEIGANANFLDGCYDLSNPITVNRFTGDDCEDLCLVNGGSISTNAPTSLCVGDGVVDSISVDLTGAMGDTSIWLITDTSGLILDLPEGPPFTFEAAGAGTCLIWHLSAELDDFSGLAVGNLADSLMGCFDLSNPIAVNRLTAEGGLLSTDSETTICVGDSIPDILLLNLSGEVGDSQIFVFTDTLGVIQDISSSDSLDLDGSGAGVCLAWSLSFSGTISGLEIGASADSLSGCFALSNPVTITKFTNADCDLICLVEASTIMALDSTIICLSDSIPDTLNVESMGGVGDSSAWVITDTLGNILSLPDGPPFAFNDSIAGVCLIWEIHFDGMIMGLELDSNANNLMGCFALSNPITVEKFTDGGPCDDGFNMDPSSMMIEMNMYPNPTVNNLNLQVVGREMFEENSFLDVLDMTGRPLFTKPYPTYKEGWNSFEVNTSHLAPGIYYLRFRNGNRFKLLRFVKQ